MKKLQFASLCQDLFETSCDLIYFANSNGEIEMVNSAFLNTFGYDLTELVGKPMLDLILPAGGNAFTKLTKESSLHVDQIVELTLLKKDGEISLVKGELRLISTNEEIYYRGVFRKLSYLGQNDNLIDPYCQISLFLENAPNAIIIIDEDQNIKEWNYKAEALFGYSKDDVKDRGLNEIIRPHQYRDAHNRGRSNFLKTGEGQVLNKTIEAIGVHKNGVEFSISLSISNVQIGDKLLFIAFIVGITEHQAINEITKSQERALKHSQLLNQKKNDFLSIASHELKTPLTTIKAFSQLALMVGKNKADPTILSYLEKINSQTDKLTHLVNELLDVSRIQSGKMIITKNFVAFDHYLQEVVNNIQLTIPTHKIVILQPIALNIEIDTIHLEQVITNLITNAAKYSPGKEVIEVTSKIQDGLHVISVRDYGVGISLKDHGRLLGKFPLVEEIINDFSGHGISLYISLEIIKQHKGEIWVESEENAGSIFSFSLPIDMA